MHEQRSLTDVGHVNDLEPTIGTLDHAPLHVGAEADRLAVHQGDQHRGPGIVGGDLLESPIVEDVAVLVHLDEGRTAVRMGPPEDLLHVCSVHVVGSGNEGRLGAERQADRIERGVDRPEWGRLGDLRHLGGRRVLPLGQAVDLVVEHQDVHPDVAPQGVDQVVAADREGVTVPGDHPDVEIRATGRQAGGDGGSPTVDRVHAVGVHVVGESGSAPDARQEDRVLSAHTQVG